MKLHTVFISCERLALTQIAVHSFLNTVTVPYTYIVVDNASSDGTQAWLEAEGHPHWAFLENQYPGRACNLGWERAPKAATHLQRADNDFRFEPGWCDEVLECFRDPTLGQLGLRTDEEEAYCEYNVGGNCIIRRELWDKGLRYDETPWPDYPPGLTEDTFLSPAVSKLGYRWGRVSRHIIQDLALPSRTDPYYQRTFAERNLGGLGRFR